MSLKELTKDLHTEAEKQPFVKEMFSGKIDPKLYAIYLLNQHAMYELLEVCAMQHGLLNDMQEIRRGPYIFSDFLELWSDEDARPNLLPSTQKYIDHIMSIKDDPKKLLSHLYVRHMGDLSGGQMIAKKVPGEGKFYKFENVDSLKAAIRAKLDDSLVDEARVCFQFSIDFFKELMEIA
jgi:heme oxygenase